MFADMAEDDANQSWLDFGSPGMAKGSQGKWDATDILAPVAIRMVFIRGRTLPALSFPCPSVR